MMKFVLFYHSLISDWNHGNAHFLRGIASELLDRGHDVQVCEPARGWSLEQLRTNAGETAVTAFHETFPRLRSFFYDDAPDLDRILDGADVVVVHEWNPPELIGAIGRHRAADGRYRLFFHDTHHRAVSNPAALAAYDLSHYDGVLAFGQVIRDLYLEKGWAAQAWTWHEAADIRVFYPRPAPERPDGKGDLVWVGNWGDEERSRELHEFLLEPVRALNLKVRVYGVRYPEQALKALQEAGIDYGGWLPNYQVPEVFARFRVTVHVPRRPYVRLLPGIPTIRPFEALACGIPLICAPWDDAEGLFTPGQDFLTARNGEDMRRQLGRVLAEPELARSLREHGLNTVRARHTCAHRVDELLAIVQELQPPGHEPGDVVSRLMGVRT